MYVSKTVSIKIEDLIRIKEYIDKGYFTSLSRFIQQAIKKQLKE